MKIALLGTADSLAAGVVRCLAGEGHSTQAVYLESGWARRDGTRFLNESASKFGKLLRWAELLLYLSRSGAGDESLELQVRRCLLPLAYMLSLAGKAPSKIQRVVVASPASLYGEGNYFCAVNESVSPQWRVEEDLRAGRWEHRCPICNGQLRPTATAETHRAAPLSVAGALAYLQERLAINWALNRRVPVVALRYFDIYGLGGTGPAAQLVRRAIEGLPLEVAEDGRQTRDYVDLEDVAGAVSVAVRTPCRDSLVLNVASGTRTSTLAFLACLEKTLGKALRIRYSGAFDRDEPRHLYAEIGELIRAGYRPRIGLHQGLKQYVEKLLEKGPRTSRGRKS